MTLPKWQPGTSHDTSPFPPIRDHLAHKRYDNLLGAEVGVFRGETARKLLIHFPRLILLCVDNWAVNSLTEEPIEDIQAEARASLYKFSNHDSRATLLELDSLEAARRQTDSTFDFVHIDADHTKPAALADMLAWWPKLKLDGVLFAHDYNHPNPMQGWDVAGAVAEFVTECGSRLQPLRHAVDGLTWKCWRHLDG